MIKTETDDMHGPSLVKDVYNYSGKRGNTLDRFTMIRVKIKLRSPPELTALLCE